MHLTLAQWGLILIAGFGVCFWLGIFIVLRTIALPVGVILLGTSAWMVRISSHLATWVNNLTGSATAWAFGTKVTWLLAAVLAVIFLHGMMPKNATKKHHAWAGAALAILLMAGTASSLPGVNRIPTDVRHGVRRAQNTVSGR
jgi:hypothetical protein